jgi:hypothetical protein
VGYAGDLVGGTTELGVAERDATPVDCLRLREHAPRRRERPIRRTFAALLAV